MAKILITGGTGFIGFHLTQALLDQGHAVSCMVRKSSKLDRLAGLPVRRDDGDVTARPLAQAHARWRATVDTSASVLPAILSRPIRKSLLTINLRHELPKQASPARAML